MPINQTTMRPFYWLWLIPAAMIAGAAVVGNPHLVALGIGLSGALSLSGSI